MVPSNRFFEEFLQFFGVKTSEEHNLDIKDLLNFLLYETTESKRFQRKLGIHPFNWLIRRELKIASRGTIWKCFYGTRMCPEVFCFFFWAAVSVGSKIWIILDRIQLRNTVPMDPKNQTKSILNEIFWSIFLAVLFDAKHQIEQFIGSFSWFMVKLIDTNGIVRSLL